jgi:hypothetical protein
VLTSLENSSLAAWIRGDSLWGWPFALTIHALGTALVIGLIFIVSLRLLGLFETIPYTALRRLFPVIWLGFAVQFLSGFALWITKPTRYVADTAFMLKFALFVAGFVLALSLFRTVKREAAAWDAAGAAASPHGVGMVAANFVVWGGVLIMGRLTAYLGSFISG